MNHNNRHPVQAGLAALIMALLLTTPASATGVCLVCPPGHTCSDSTATLAGTAGQVLVRDGTTTAWKDVATVALQGPQGARGATGPQGASASADNLPCFTYAGAQVTKEGGTFASNTSATGSGTYCWCRLKSAINTSCVSSWVSSNVNCNGSQACIGGCGVVCDGRDRYSNSFTW